MVPAARLLVREARPDEVVRVLDWTHALWGANGSLADYRARTQALLASPWGRARYRFVVGLAPDGRPVSACKRYRLAMRRGGEALEAVGFGAVFTPPAERGRGYASTLLRAVMAEEAARGARLALLYSDIGPGFYARLGFSAPASWQGEAPAWAGASPFRVASATETQHAAAWLASASRRGELTYAYPRDYWAYLLARKQPTLWAYAPAGVARGFVAGLMIDEEALWVMAAGHDEQVDARAFWQGVRAHAHALQQPAAAGWLPEEARSAGFELTPVREGLPMVRPLDGSSAPATARLWDLDHF